MKIRETPWGFEELLWTAEPLTVKILHAKPGQRMSLQLHRKRDEEWVVLSDSCFLDDGTTRRELTRGERVVITRGTKHRLGAEEIEAVVLEISRGHFDQDDIERFKDDYGRV